MDLKPGGRMGNGPRKNLLSFGINLYRGGITLLTFVNILRMFSGICRRWVSLRVAWFSFIKGDSWAFPTICIDLQSFSYNCEMHFIHTWNKQPYFILVHIQHVLKKSIFRPTFGSRWPQKGKPVQHQGVKLKHTTTTNNSNNSNNNGDDDDN